MSEKLTLSAFSAGRAATAGRARRLKGYEEIIGHWLCQDYPGHDGSGNRPASILHNVMQAFRRLVDAVVDYFARVTRDVTERMQTQRVLQRAAALTSRLLAFSRRQALDPKPMDPTC